MIFKSIWMKEGLFERTIEFTPEVNLIYSEENSKGKTTLLRFMLFSLGYNIPNTKNIKFDRCEVKSIVVCDDGKEVNLYRSSADFIEVTYENEKQTIILPDQLHDLHSIIFATTNADILDNLLGAYYADQEKGWTLLNRGTVIGSIHFNIESLIRGLSGIDCSDLIRKEATLSRELSKYRQMQSVARYRESILQESGTLVQDSYEDETDAEKSELLIQQQMLKKELRRIDKTLTDNKRLKDYISKMKLMIQLDDGSVVPVTENNLVGFSDTIDFLITKRKMVATDLKNVNHKLEFLQKEQTSEAEQLSFFKSESMADIFDRKIAAVPIDAVSIDNEIKRLDKRLKEVREELSRITRSDNSIMTSMYNNMIKYATELNVGDKNTTTQKYLFTSNLKELSGAVLHKTVFAFRLAYIAEIEKKLGIKLPIILDSPSGKEVDHKNIQLMVDILKRDFSDNQIIIASIFDYSFDSVNRIEIKDHLIQ